MGRHNAVSQVRWMSAQQQEAKRWHGSDALDKRRIELQKYYWPLIKDLDSHLHEDSRILEIGCGPVCLAQWFKHGEKTYVDPLINDYRRAYPRKLPKGQYISRAAESIDLDKQQFDVILCLQTLDKTQNPELVLNEIGRLLRDEAIVVVSLTLVNPLRARLHYYLEQIMPHRQHIRPYRYSKTALERSLSRHFECISVDPVHAHKRFWPWQSQTWMYRCRKKHSST